MNTREGGGAVRNALRTVGRGFLLGVGFSIPLAGLFLAIQRWTVDQERAALTAFTPGPVKEIVLSDTEEQQHDGATWIVGTAKNTGKRPARVEVQANLFLRGKFVDQYSQSIPGRIEAGASKYFKIECGCKGSTPTGHDSFKVEVASAVDY